MFKNHPKGLLLAALSNMGERFGYYIMNAVLALFLCSKFGLSDGQSGFIAAMFLTAIYVLSLVGGIIADRTQNYKATIAWGLVIMAMGYVLLSIPVLATPDNMSWLLPFTVFALALIACGNGLFKGNLQAIVGQMYDNFEEAAAHEGPERLKWAQGQRDAGFQIFYVFINVGALVAPFVAPLLRSWWLNAHGLAYNAALPKLCHAYISGNIGDSDMQNLTELVAKVGGNTADLSAFCTQYLDIFNTGIHYSFIASVVTMLISLCIFLLSKHLFPTPGKKKTVVSEQYTEAEKKNMAKEIKQRMYALFAVLGIAVFFWFSFHQNGQSLSFFARDFVQTDSIAPEIWQAVNPFFVIFLTPIIMWFFSRLTARGRAISTPRKIAYGMGIAGIAYLFLAVFSFTQNYPSANEFTALSDSVKDGLKAGPWVLIVTYFFLTVAELFISPLGLSFVSKVAPKHLQGLCQGLWLGATAVGNGLLWIGPLIYNEWPIWMCWTVFLVVCVISMGVMLGMVRWLERVTG
ncbi:MAG: peptide MFS transporter [Bacteroidaceae bacterium]|nr:peptide MFS transporter [Bacteroidaceae bacterium]